MTTSRSGRIDRRRLVASSAIGGAAILTGGSLARGATGTGQSASLMAQDDSADVPMFRGNAARTGEMPGPGPDDSNGVEAIWRITAGEGEDRIPPAYSSPVVVDGVVYVVRGWNLYALNANDGTERWQFAEDLGAYHASTPAVVDMVMYFGHEGLYAVNIEDGSERWRFAADSGIASSPAVVDDVVYVVSIDHDLYAVNAEDGTERWRFATGDVPIVSSPAVVDGVVYVGGLGLYAVDAEDGAVRWRFETDTLIESPPAVVDGVVYVGSRDNFYAVNTEDGGERWRFATGGVNNRSSPAVADRVVFIGDGDLYAVNAEDGTERWRFATGDAPIFSFPAVVGGVVYVGNGAGNFYAVNAEDGTERWRFATGDAPIVSSPAVVDGVVYVLSYDGSLQALGARVPTLSAGGAARVTATVSLRGGPAPTAVERAELAPDTIVALTGEPVTTGDVEWWPVVVDDTGDAGWVEASVLKPLSSGPESTPTA